MCMKFIEFNEDNSATSFCHLLRLTDSDNDIGVALLLLLLLLLTDGGLEPQNIFEYICCSVSLFCLFSLLSRANSP